MFAGLTSRCTWPAACAVSSADATGDVPHSDEQRTVSVAGFVHRNDVRIIDRGRHPRFPDEPVPESVVGGQCGSKYLQRDLAAEPFVPGPENDGHAALPDLLFEQVPTDPRAHLVIAGQLRKVIPHPILPI